MEITQDVRAALLNLGGNTHYEDARAAEIGSSSDEIFMRCKELATELYEQLNVGVGRISASGNLNGPWQTSIVTLAFTLRDIELLTFLHCLMVPAVRDADLLRIVFTHACNLGLDHSSITEESVDAYQRMTVSMFGGCNTFVPSVAAETSSELISRVLSSHKEALIAGHYLRQIRQGSLEPMIEYLNTAVDIDMPLLEGAL